MVKFFYAVASNNASSKKLSSRQDAEDWARDYLSKTPSITQVFILEGLGAVERASPPIQFTPVKNGQHSLDLPEGEDRN